MEAYIPVKLKVRKFIPAEKRNDDKEYKWEDFGFNLALMSHWKPYTNEDEQGNPMLHTMLYMKDAPKGIVLQVNGEAFLEACRNAVKEWKGFLLSVDAMVITGDN